jgi:hypothetical protein
MVKQLKLICFLAYSILFFNQETTAQILGAGSNVSVGVPA